MVKEDFFDKIKSSTPKATDCILPGQRLNTPVITDNGLQDVGIELELEGVNLPSQGYFDKVKAPSGARWERKADGSLRNGWEYVLTSPCKKDEITPLVQGFYNVLDSNKTRLKLSNRCSTHVHINMGGLKINEVTAMVALWYTFETSLIAWCGESRKTNHFCLSHKDSPQIANVWNSYLKTGKMSFSGCKYSALNPKTLTTFGSLEFRCMGGAEKAEDVIKWSKLLLAMRDYAKQNYQNLYDIASSLSERGPEEILKDILTEDEPFFDEIMEVNRDNNFTSDCMEGFRSFQKNILEFPWEEVMEEIASVYVPDPFQKPLKKAPSTRRIRPDPFVDELRRARPNWGDVPE